MLNRPKKSFSLLLGLALALSTCGIDPTGKISGTSSKSASDKRRCVATNDSYKKFGFDAVHSLVDSQCVSCHSPSGKTAPDLSDESLIRSSKETIVSEIRSGAMPPGNKMSAESIKVFNDWESDGFAAFGFSLADAPTYYGNIEAIFGSKCTMCHSATAPDAKREKPYLTTYAQVANQAKKSLEEMQKGSMPPKDSTPLAPGDLSTVRSWSAAGKPQGTPAQVDLPPAGSQIVYNDDIFNLMKARCASCHKPGLTAPDLSTYESAKANSASVLTAMNAGTMPPSGKLASPEITLFQSWVDAGFPLGKANSPVQDEKSPSSGNCKL